ncbi:MAG: PAS domain S-box protein [Planctomycetes bacterium]|nr:PAS domain S-box protein [Planctomycetota bacterium]
MTPEQFLLFADPFPEPMALLSGNGLILSVNRATEERLGISPRELRGRKLTDVVVEPSDEVAHYLRSCSRSRQMVLGSLALVAKDGNAIACRTEGTLVRTRTDDSEAVLLMRLTPKESAVGQFVALNQRIEELGKEIQRRKHAEEVAREQEERLRVTLQCIGDAVIVTDPEGRVTSLNSVAESLTGWRHDDAVNHALEEVFSIVNESTRTTVENPAVRALREGVIVGLANHTVLIARDGTERAIDDSAAPIRDGHGNVVGAVLVFRDITNRKLAEEESRRSEDRFRQLADAMPQIVWTARPDGYIDYSNRRWFEFTGSTERIGNDEWAKIVHPADLPPASLRWAESIRSGAAFEMELRLMDRNTRGYRWHLIRTVPVRNETGDIAHWYGTSTDIHQQKRSGDAARFLAHASASLAALVDEESTLQKVAGLAVPFFADWATIDLAEGDGTLRRVAVAHVDPSKVELAREMHRRFPPDPTTTHGVWNILRTGKSELVSEITDALLVESVKDAELLGIMRELGLKSYMGVPLRVRGKTLGVITFIAAESGVLYDASDLAVAEDLAHRAAIAMENTELYRELRETDRRKDEFLATLAHELRNPLAPIRNGLQIMRLAGNNKESVERTHGIMERQLGQMVRLVDDLLDLSRISRGKIELRKERIELASVVSSALETCDPAIKQQGHELTLKLPEEPVYIDGDRTRLAQSLCNLLGNAVKYSDKGGHIWLTVERQGGEAVVSVKDAGVGIAAPMLPRVFDMFTQVDRTLEKSQGGLGIGLAIVKRLVEMHDGRIEARSEGQGKGSEFVIRLPLAPLSVRKRPVESEAMPVGGAACRRILVVDDNVDAASSLAVMLDIMGHEVRTAHDGESGIELAAAFRPDLILMDIGMPRLNGYDACRRIREQPWGRNIEVVALTGWGQADDRRKSQEAGFDRHMVKPVDIDLLTKLLATFPNR